MKKQFQKGLGSKEALKDAFAVFDKKRTGRLSRQELSTILTTIGDKMTQAEVDDLIRMADRDGKYNLMAGDGQLDYEEFARFLTSK